MSTGRPPRAIIVETSRRRVDVTGSDRASYLEDVTSQSFTEAPTGTATSALVLDAHGAPQAAFEVAVLADRVALLAPDDTVAAFLVDVLGQRTFLLDAAFTLTGDLVASLRGEDAAEVAEAANLHVRADTVRPAGDEVAVLGVHGGVDLVGPPHAVREAIGALTAAGARPGGAADLEAWRVAAGVPGWGSEITAPHLPEEAGVLATHVHLGKGCYPGQEAVARMWMLGRPRRRLVQLEVTDDGRLTPGWHSGEGRRGAAVTSVSPDGLTALAYAPATVEAGQSLEGDDGVTAQVRRIVGADRVPAGHDPSVTRRRDRAGAR